MSGSEQHFLTYIVSLFLPFPHKIVNYFGLYVLTYIGGCSSTYYICIFDSMI